MSKILVDVDHDDLFRAAARLGTSTKKDTIGRALELVARGTEERAAVEAWDEWADSLGERIGEVDWGQAWR